MNLIDDKGHLFGTINIIDALVVLLVLAVVAAGAAFVLQSSDSGDTPTEATPENATRYATLDLGTHPGYVADRVTENDTTPNADLAITDVYRTPTDDGVRVWTQVRLDGQLVERENASEFTFADAPVTPGRALPIATSEYAVNGTVHEVSDENASLARDTAEVAVRTAMTAEKASAIRANDTYTVAGETVATVESVEFYPSQNQNRTLVSQNQNRTLVSQNQNRKLVTLGLTLDTLRTTGHEQFLGRSLRIGDSVPFRTDDYAIETEVVHRGSHDLPGESTTVTATVELANATPAVADAIESGMTERGSDGVRARVTDKHVENATVVLKSESGTIHEREHPRKQNVTLTVELDARRTDAGLHFHGRQLRMGDDLVLDLDSLTVRGQVVDLQQTRP
ncbi:DUF4330 family protein [Halorussus halobius]|uniref:DUF4330 family protein n=1 Tax=Halorussus halobius TaxID=1710537 RepID=UPI0010921048|nr:DUF4330 family protein [Halorussus halobius]